VSEFRRGFKSEVDRLVDEIRREFRVRPLDPLDPAELAQNLGIPVVGISECDEMLSARFLTSTLCDRFHAATIPVGTGVAIVHNDAAAVTRQRSNIAHELGHTFLEHPFFPVNTEDGPERDSAIEREASWFGFALLVTPQAALAIARTRMSIEDAAETLGVSVEAVRYRVDVTGANKRARRERER